MYHFCTISTADHLYKAFALFDSIKNQGHSAQLHALVVDENPPGKHAGVELYSLKDISASAVAKKIISKYSSDSDKDKLRWALKAVFLKHLLVDKKTDKVVYVDSDVFFFNDYRFLFDLLDAHSFLLTPHNYPRNPNSDQIWLEANFRVGLYNAGFVGVNRNALSALDWWGECCAYKTERNAWRGLHDDQKYLDLIPVMLEDACIIRHKGCNVADWNNHVCPRTEVNGEILIENIFPIVFIHFNATTIRSLMTGKEPMLEKHFDAYVRQLKQHQPGIERQHLLVKHRWRDTLKLIIWDLLTK